MYELLYSLTACSLLVLYQVACMYGSSLHVEVFCSAARSAELSKSLSFATSFARSRQRLCPLKPGLQMDSPGSAQPRSSYADPPVRDSTFPHGSSAKVQKGLISPLSSVRKEGLAMTAQSMERRGAAARQDGISLAVSQAINTIYILSTNAVTCNTINHSTTCSRVA